MVGIVRIMAMAVAAAMVLPGCSGRGDWAGEWKGTRPLEAPPGTDPLIAKSYGAVKLVIKPDGHFELTEETFGKAGSAVLGSDSGTLDIDTVLGRRPANLGPNGLKLAGQRTVKLQKDGTLLFLRPNYDPVVLKRVAPDSQTGSAGTQ